MQKIEWGPVRYVLIKHCFIDYLSIYLKENEDILLSIELWFYFSREVQVDGLLILDRWQDLSLVSLVLTASATLFRNGEQ